MRITRLYQPCAKIAAPLLEPQNNYQMQSPARLNDYYIDGSWGSPGEAYHIAIHALLLPPEEVPHFGIIPAKGKDEAKLFEFLDDLRITYWKGRPCSRKMGLSETANTMFQRWHRDQVTAKRWIIQGLARDDRWENPFEEMLRHNKKPKVLIWQRPEETKYESWRNSKRSLTLQMIQLLEDNGVTPVLIGPTHRGRTTVNLGQFWDKDFFKLGHCLCKQLWFVNDLFENHNVLASIGMMSGGMDGAALFFGRKTIFLARDSDAKPRMAKVASVVPGMHWLSVDYGDDKGLESLPDHILEQLKTLIGLPLAR